MYTQAWRLSPPVCKLNDDSLLHIFDHYQLIFSKSYEDVLVCPEWNNARWWYKLAQVCQQWRHLILGSPIRLGLHLVCTYGTPVANMLIHSPPLPLVINYLGNVREPSTEDKDSILLALQHCDRVSRIGLQMSVANLVEPIKAMDGQFPVLERLFIWPSTQDDINLILPTTFRAPHLGQISLSYAALPVGSPLLTTTIGLTSLELRDMPLAAYFHPSNLIAPLASMPQLERLSIGFTCPIPTSDVERRPLRTLGTYITLPNLRLLYFRGVRAYLEGVLSRISTPLLEVFHIRLFNQLSFTLTHLLRFMDRTESLRFRFAWLVFSWENVTLTMHHREGDSVMVNPLEVVVDCMDLDWQVSAITQIFNALAPALSATEGLSFRYGHDLSSEQHNESNRSQWRNLLIPFSGINAFYVAGELITKVAHSLQIEDGEAPLELLPELKELTYEKDGDPSDAFTPFIDARNIAGRPVSLIQLPLRLHHGSESCGAAYPSTSTTRPSIFNGSSLACLIPPFPSRRHRYGP